MANKDYGINIGYPIRDKNFVLPLINGEEAWRTVFNHIKTLKNLSICVFGHLKVTWN